jgi:hypothetical protein
LAKRETGYLRLQQLLPEDILTSRIPEGSRLKVGDNAARYTTSTNPAPEALLGLEARASSSSRPIAVRGSAQWMKTSSAISAICAG